MPYTVIFGDRKHATCFSHYAMTAREALAMTKALQDQQKEIMFIRSPQEGEFGVEMLRVLAKEEEEEMPIAPD